MAGIKLNLKGFEQMLEELQEAGKDIDTAAQRAVTESAKIVEQDLRAECAASGVPSDVTDEIIIRTSQEGGLYEANVGWKMGSYNPRDPSAGYKAVFLNYGTVRRKTRKRKNRGEIEGLQFISKAKKKSRPKVKKAQQKLYETLMKDVGK